MLTILAGLIGLSIVVIFHELGHFFAARSVGVEVEAFSIGWGPKLLGKKWGKTEWRISALPLGGFCKMKGEDDFKKAIDLHLDTIPGSRDSFYGASPWKRIIILFSGPFMNVLFAIVMFSFVWLVGITVTTAPNRILLASEFSKSAEAQTAQNPADKAGLQSGDTILSLDGKAVRDYSDIQELVGLNPGKTMNIEILRDGMKISTTITPMLDKNSGQGLIGIYAWVDPVIEKIDSGTSAEIAGLLPGDTVLSINGQAVKNTIDIMKILESKPEVIEMTVQRGSEQISKKMVIVYSDANSLNLGIQFKTIVRRDQAGNLGDALIKGTREFSKTFSMTIRGLGLLFSGVNVLKAISGPARLTYIIGNAATESIKQSGLAGIVPILNFLAFLSVGLFIMNLLPIPALDGGQILLSLSELIKGKPISTKAIYRFQTIGMVMVLALFLFATFSDVLFFSGK